jgi:hypothetical protein
VEESKFPLTKENKDEQVKILTMFTVFSDKKGTVPPEFVPQGQTINQAFYLEIL